MKMTKKEFRERVLRDQKRRKEAKRQAERNIEDYFREKIRKCWNIREKQKQK